MVQAKEHIHLIGIGGTGMTALAGLLHEAGCRVTGSDHALYPPTSTILERLGLETRTGFDERHLDPAPDLVVVGNAISRGNPEVERVLDGRLPYTSMPRLIEERFLPGRHSIVVAGTHGKTTTASMLAWVLDQAGREPGFLIGGSPMNFDLPFRLGRGDAFVIEGDEYDTAFFDKGPKFMHYRPDTVMLGTVEFDHADIYRDLDEIRTAFRRLVNIVPRRGLIVRHEESRVTCEVSSEAPSRVEGYGLETGRWRADGLTDDERGTRFRILRDGEPYADVSLRVHGQHNVRNALAVTGAAAEQGLTAAEIARGLGSFRGVRRRLELRGDAGGVRVFDDFAHHPTAIEETLLAVRRAHPEARIWAVLEPRSWSLRRNVFQERLSVVFDAADRVVIAPVFGSEAVSETERLDPRVLIEALKARGLAAEFADNTRRILDLLEDQAVAGDIVVIMSNGGFEGLHDRLLATLSTRRVSAPGSSAPTGTTGQ